jgi:dTDP-4-amino-4,6-dideoxygalactose transaminase
VTTNDDRLAAQIRLMKNFGFAGYDNVVYVGTNGKMSEISAAMGLSSLEKLDEFIEVNRANYLRYREGLADLSGIRMIRHDEGERRNFQYVIAEIDEGVTGLSRDHLLQVLHAENVIARRYFYPGCHRMEPYRSYFPHAAYLLPETERLVQRVICLPTGTAVDDEAIDTICRIVRCAGERGPEISELLAENAPRA